MHTIEHHTRHLQALRDELAPVRARIALITDKGADAQKARSEHESVASQIEAEIKRFEGLLGGAPTEVVPSAPSAPAGKVSADTV